MYSTTDFRRGLKIEIDGTPYEIVEFQHFKPGKGGAMVRTKLRNILNGRVVDNTFRSGEKVGKPDMEQRDMQYLYREGTDLVFMDMTTYEQISLPEADTDGKADWLLESQQCRVLLYNGQPIDIEVPVSLVMTVVKTEPGVKGDTVSNVTKPATLETGVVIQVPIASRSIPAPANISAATNSRPFHSRCRQDVFRPSGSVSFFCGKILSAAFFRQYGCT